MVLWALRDNPEKGIPTSGMEAKRLRDKAGEEHTYYHPELVGKEVSIRSGSDTHLRSARDHFFLNAPAENGTERRAPAEVGRIGIEAVLRESGDMYDVGRGRLFTEWDSSEYSHKDRTNRNTGFEVVYARQTRDGKAPVDYVVLVFNEPPNSKDYWQIVESCFKSGPKNGVEKYVVGADGSRTHSLGTGRSKTQRNGAVYVATVLLGNPDSWKSGSHSFVKDMLERTGMPLNFYDLVEGAMMSVGGSINGGGIRKETTFSLAPKDFAKGSFVVGSKPGHPKSTDRVGLAYFVDQAQRSLFADSTGEQTSLL